MVRFHPGSLDERATRDFRSLGYSRAKNRSVGVLVAHFHGREGDRVQFPDGPLLTTQLLTPPLRVCSWESSQIPTLADGVRILALVLSLADMARYSKAPVSYTASSRKSDKRSVSAYKRNTFRRANGTNENPKRSPPDTSLVTLPHLFKSRRPDWLALRL